MKKVIKEGKIMKEKQNNNKQFMLRMNNIINIMLINLRLL